MAHVTGDRIQETTTTTGTGALALLGAVANFQAFSAKASNNDTVAYTIVHQTANEWEVGIGTWTTGNNLARTTVLDSSNAGAVVTLSAGTKDVWCDHPADFEHIADLTPAQITADQNNYAPTGWSGFKTLLRLDTDQRRRITGLASGRAGRLVVLQNVSAGMDGTIILTHEGAGSTAANRFNLGVRDVALNQNECAVLQYDAVSSRWKLLSHPATARCAPMRYNPFMFCDFHIGTSDASMAAPFERALISAGSFAVSTDNIVASQHAQHPGVNKITSSATANSGAWIGTPTASILLAGGEVAEFCFLIETLTNTTHRFGFHDATSSTDAVDGAYIELPAGSGAAVGKTSSNSTRTTSATIATLVVNTWYRAKIVVNRDATAVDFYLFNDAGNQLGTVQNTTNIPTASGRETACRWISTNSGTVVTDLAHLDYMAFEETRALNRG